MLLSLALTVITMIVMLFLGLFIVFILDKWERFGSLIVLSIMAAVVVSIMAFKIYKYWYGIVGNIIIVIFSISKQKHNDNKMGCKYL